MSKKKTPRAIVVLGMHRSGTSALTRVVNFLGAELGPNLMAPVPGENDLGFWEPLEIVAIHDRILEVLGSRWDDALPLPARWWLRPDVLTYRDELLSILKEQFSGVPLWAIKDPRLCRLLPLWKSIFSELRCEASYLIIARNPHEVADSLARRNQIPLEKSYLMWLDNVLESIHQTEGHPRAFITYDRLLSDWRGTLRDAARTLNLRWPRPITKAQREIDSFLDDTLRNHISSVALVDRDPAIPVWLPDVYAAIRKAAEQGETPHLRRVFAKSRREMLSAFRMHEPELGRWRADLSEAHQEIERSHTRAKALEAGLASEREEARKGAARQEHAESSLATIRLELEAAARELTQTRSEVALRHSEAARQNAVVEKVGAEHDRTRAQLTITTEKLVRSRSKLQVTEEELVRLQEQLSATSEDLLGERSRLEETRVEFDQTRTSLAERTAELDRRNVEREAAAVESVQLHEQLAETGGNLSSALVALEGAQSELSEACRRFEDRKIQQEQRRKALFEKALRAQKRLRARAHELSSLRQLLDIERQERGHDRNDAAAEISSARDDLMASNAEIARLSQLISDQDADLTSVRTKLDTMTAEVNRLSGSRSWRYALPLRLVATRARSILGLFASARSKFRSTRRSRRESRFRVLLGLQTERQPATTSASDDSESGLSGSSAAKLPAEDAPTLSLPKSKHPRASIVVPAYNHFEETYACLVAIREHTSNVEYEVIVVDDHSEDEHRELERYVANVRVVHNQENLGFVGSCNRGAQVARGDYLVFLNNDTLVQEGWLSALLGTFDDHLDAGLVGAQLIYPDGRLQEAGGIIWSDGDGWNYGRYDDSGKPEYNYVREVDYCSGACIAIPRNLFFELEMFDSRYAPAFYEDTDLAFAVRAGGHRVFYQPAAVVVHVEGATTGNDTTSGVKQFQVVNREKFVSKWSAALERQPSHEVHPDHAKDRGCRQRVLVIDAYTPMPDRDSGSVRMHHILEILGNLDCQVTFIPDNLAHASDHTRSLQRMGVEALYHPHITSIPEHLSEHGARYDVIIISRVDVATKYIDAARRFCPNARLIFDTVDLHFLRETRQQEILGGEVGADARRHEELGVAAKADITVVVSPAEREFLAQQAPELTVEVVSNIHRVHLTTRKFRARSGILFIGSFQHPPNADAVEFYLREVHPLVLKKLPDVEFTVIGSDPPEHLRHLAGKGVHFVGHVENIQELFANARLSVAPLRFGAGVKGKINSSMSFGVPVITTSIGAEGMGLKHGEHAMIADTPDSFSEAVLAVYSSKRLWSRLVRGGVENLESCFSVEFARTALARIIDTDRVIPSALHPEAGERQAASRS